MKKKIVGICVCMLLIATTLPVINAVSVVKKSNDEHPLNGGWVKDFEGTSWASSVIQTSDGGYLVAGGTGYKEGSDALLIKTDAEGNIQWEKTFGDLAGWDAFWGGLVETSDGGFVASGTNNVTSYLVKVDANGNTTWEQTYGDPTMGSILDFQQTPDNGFILTGRVYHEPRRGWLIKTDSEGNVTWNKTLGGEHPTTLWTIRITDDGGYIMAGFEKDPNKLFPISYAVKTDASGNVEWENNYDSSQGFKHGVVQTADGGYLFAGGMTLVPRLNVRQISLIKTDAEGNELWSKYLGTPFLGDSSFWLEETSDGDCVLAGYYRGLGTVFNFFQTGDYVPLWSRMWLLKIDTDGNLIWDKKVETGVGRCVKQTAEGGYILAGLRGAYNRPKGILLIKTDENGNID